MMKTNPFLQTIYNLRQQGELVLFGQKHNVPHAHKADVIDFLRHEYEDESIGYPHVCPEFDADAAIWAAGIVFWSTHLLLHRELSEKDLPGLISRYQQPFTPSVFLSADLCLRFLPQIVLKLKEIDNDDALIPMLTSILNQFHYSALGFDVIDFSEVDFDRFVSDKCLCQLYLDRVWERNASSAVNNPRLAPMLHANFGDHRQTLWPDFHLLTTK